MPLSEGQKDRLAKNVIESIFGAVGGAAGKTALGTLLTPYVGGNGLIQEVIGIGTATAIEVPMPFAAALSKMTGGSPATVHRYLNEGIDASLKALTASAAANPNRPPTEAEFAAAAQQGIATFNAADRRGVMLQVGAHRVIVDAKSKTFHDLNCPVCTRSVQQKRKGGGEEKRSVALQEMCKEVDARWALENGYAPTTAPCCGISATKVVQNLAATETNLLTALTKLGERHKAQYRVLVETANVKQREKISACGNTPKFTPDTLALLLDMSSNPDAFLQQISEPEKPTAASGVAGFIGKMIKALKGPDETDPGLQATRNRSQEQADQLNQKTTKTRQRTSALRSLNNKR